MNDRHALEVTASKTPKAVEAEDHDQLARHFWERAKAETGYRERLKLLKRSSFFAGHAFDRGIDDAEALRLYMEILGQTARVHSFPHDIRRALSKVTVRWLEATGASEQKLVTRKKGNIATETAAFAIGDVGMTPTTDFEPWTKREMVAWMKSGERLVFSTGYDGMIGAELRLIESAEPVLEANEYGRLESSTPTLVLKLPTGGIGLADYGAMAEQWRESQPHHSLFIDVPPGRYKCAVYGFSTRRKDRVVAVLCQTDAEPANAVESVDSLFM